MFVAAPAADRSRRFASPFTVSSFAVLLAAPAAVGQGDGPIAGAPIYYTVATGQVATVPKGVTAVCIERATVADLKALQRRPELTHLQIRAEEQDDNGVAPEGVDLLLGMKQLRSLDMYGQVHLTATGMARLGEHPGLRELVLGQTGYLLDEHCVAFAKNTHVERLSITLEPGVQSTGYAALAKVGSLRHLAVSYPEFPVSLLEPLRSSASLRSLSLAECEDLGDAHAAWLARMPALEAVDMSLTKVTRAGVQKLAALKGLKRLRLGWTGELFDDAAAAFVADTWPELEQLCINEAQALTDAGVQRLASMPRLHTLEAYGCPKLTGAAAKALAGAAALRNLDLSYSDWLDDRALIELAGNGSLETLRLAGCEKLTSRGLGALKKLDQLAVLDLSFVPAVTDGVASSFARMRRLRSIAFCGCEKVGDRAVNAFMRHKQLRLLGVDGCARVSEKVKARFRKRGTCCLDG